MAQIELHPHAYPLRAPLPALVRLVLSFNPARLITRQTTRRALARLDSHLLHDIGLPADTARNEATKAFWQD
ncbi:MAG: DUF1127 domain-containing protein [Paracoccaceae bacterium]